MVNVVLQEVDLAKFVVTRLRRCGDVDTFPSCETSLGSRYEFLTE